jgi:hypothetical protein
MPFLHAWQKRKERKYIYRKKKVSACRGEGSAVGLQLRVHFVPAALLAMLRTALALQCVSKARDWMGHVARCPAFSRSYIRLCSELIYLLVSCRAGREEARSFWHHTTASTPGANVAAA